MKKILIGTAAALALSLAFAPANASPDFNASQYCTDNADFGFGHGDCTKIVTKIVNKTGSDDAVAFCQDWKLEFPDDFDAAFKNMGDCVKTLNG
jgi:hypothetical protein